MINKYTIYGLTNNQPSIAFNGDYKINNLYLMGNGYRLYSPKLRRFYSLDSMSPSNKAGINPYTFVNGDPINYSDPTGHMPNTLQTKEQPNQPNTTTVGRFVINPTIIKTPEIIANEVANEYGVKVTNNISSAFRADSREPNALKRIGGFIGHKRNWKTINFFGDSTVFASKNIEGVNYFVSSMRNTHSAKYDTYKNPMYIYKLNLDQQNNWVVDLHDNKPQITQYIQQSNHLSEKRRQYNNRILNVTEKSHELHILGPILDHQIEYIKQI